jgi:hypothetical protein
VTSYAEVQGLHVLCDVRVTATAGAYLVDVEFDVGDGLPTGGEGLLFEVADWVNGARVLDPGDHDLTVDQAIRYTVLRAQGASAASALNQV